MKSLDVRLAAAFAVACLLPATAGAQTNAISPFAVVNQATGTASVPRGDVFGGVAFWNEDEHTFTGLHLSGAFRTGRHFALVGDLAFYDGLAIVPSLPMEVTYHERFTTIMGGVRVYGTGQKVSLFGQFLVGSAPLDDIAFQPGVGVDVQLGRHMAVRAGFDVKISGDDGSTYVGTRFSTGLVIQLGRQ